jgi:hypothetical protein
MVNVFLEESDATFCMLPYFAIALIMPLNITKCIGKSKNQYNLPLKPLGIKVAVWCR